MTAYGQGYSGFWETVLCYMDAKLSLDTPVNHKGVHVDHKGVSFYVVSFWVIIWQFHTMLTLYTPLQWCHNTVCIMLWCHCDTDANAMHPSIADTLRKVLCKPAVNPTNSSRVIAIFVPALQFLITVALYLWIQCLHDQDLPLVLELLLRLQ